MGKKRNDKVEAPANPVAAKATETGKSALSGKDYDRALKKLHVELVKMQEWVVATGQKVVIIFEGRDTARKGGRIKAIIEGVNVKTRVELLVTELGEEKYRLMSMWSKAIAAAFLLGMGVLLGVFALPMAFWEQRVLVFGLFATLFSVLAVVLVGSLKRQAAQPPKLFRASLAELEADMAALRRHAHRAESE